LVAVGSVVGDAVAVGTAVSTTTSVASATSTTGSSWQPNNKNKQQIAATCVNFFINDSPSNGQKIVRIGTYTKQLDSDKYHLNHYTRLKSLSCFYT
jgi:hypothetical protein